MIVVKWRTILPVAMVAALVIVTPLAVEAKRVDDPDRESLMAAAADVDIPAPPEGRADNHGWTMSWVNQNFDTVLKDMPNDGVGLNHGQVVSAFAHLNKDNKGKHKGAEKAKSGQDQADDESSNQDKARAKTNKGKGQAKKAGGTTNTEPEEEDDEDSASDNPNKGKGKVKKQKDAIEDEDDVNKGQTKKD